MNLNYLFPFVLTAVLLFPSRPMAQGVNSGVPDIRNLIGSNPEEALEEARAELAELRASPRYKDTPSHPAIAQAAANAGMLASMIGAHEEAVQLLQEALPVIADTVRDGHLLVDELMYAGRLVRSLQELQRPGDALEVLDGLEKRTRKDIVRNPRASSLKGQTDTGEQIDLGAVVAREEWLITILEQIGMLHLEDEHWADAEKALREAEEILRRLQPDENQGQLVKLREGWEQAAREQGKPVRPRLVGRFGNPGVIEFEEAAEIKPEEIRSALARSGVYVLASHPSAEFDDYLKSLQRCLLTGYRSKGFPDVSVTVDWNEAQDAVVAQIVEGPRFKTGQIQIRGAKALGEEILLESLRKEEDGKARPVSREERSYQALAEGKRLQGPGVAASIEKVFPGSLSGKKEEKQENEENLFSDLESAKSSSPTGMWAQGEWVDYQPSYLRFMETLVRSAYAEQGRFFPKVELTYVPGADPGVVDLAVEVTDEGPPALLGKIHVSGNRINSRDELLKFLELEEGMELHGAYVDQVKRALFESGRFFGWEVIPRRAKPGSSEIDLLIIVAEEWEAPPLSQALTAAQEAVLRFAKWINAEAGNQRDLVFSAVAENDLGSFAMRVALGKDRIGISMDGLEHHLRAAVEPGALADLVIRSEHGPPFYVSFPVGENIVKVNGQLTQFFPSSPLAKTGTFSFGAGFSSSAGEMLALGMDPAAALKMCGSEDGLMHRVEDGELVVEGDELTLRVDALSGQLISLHGESKGVVVVGTSEPDAVARIQKEIEVMSKGAVNWGEGKKPTSLFFMAMGYLGELTTDEELADTGPTAKMLARAGKRAKRWDPLATFLGEVSGSIGEAFASLSQLGTSIGDAPFTIPFDSENLPDNLQTGANLTMLLGLGVYDAMAQYIEPGSWPDLVTREMLFLLDGKSYYLNQTVEKLLEDETMGPLGALLCSRLLQQLGHAGALKFARKAKENVDAEGFAHDWRLVFRGTAKEDGFGWKILRAVANLQDEQIDEFLPADPPEIRSTFKTLAAKAREVDEGTAANALGPVMNSVWENLVGEFVEKAADDAVERLTPKWDPKLVAGTVNDMPLYRGALRLEDELEGEGELEQMFPVTKQLRMLNTMKDNDPGKRSFEACAGTMLFAQQLWNEGRGPLPQAIENYSGLIATALGADWEARIAKMGLESGPFQWWVRARITSEVYGESIVGQAKITPKEVKAFYGRRPDLFLGSPTTPVCMVSLKMTGDGAEQRTTAENLVKQVKGAADLNAKIKIMEDGGGENFGDVDPSYEWNNQIAAAVDQVEDGAVSDVIEIDFGGGHKELYVILIAGERKAGQVLPLEQVEPLAGRLAVLDRELSRLRSVARVEVIEEAVIAEVAPNEKPEPDGAAAAVGLLAKHFPGWVPDKGENGAQQAPEEQPPAKEKWTVEQVQQKAVAGSAIHRYFLGTFAEKEILDEKGVEAAVGHYKVAADGGERRAMLRLAELYRRGQGVERDVDTSIAWREKAEKAEAAAMPPR